MFHAIIDTGLAIAMLFMYFQIKNLTESVQDIEYYLSEDPDEYQGD